MEKRTIETFDVGMGKFDAHKIRVTDEKEKEVRAEYVEVYRHGHSDPEHMMAWFGSVQSFAQWICGSEVKDF